MEGRKFSSFDSTINAIKKAYKPFNGKTGENLLGDLGYLVVYGQDTRETIVSHRKVRGKKEQIPIYESETYTKIIKDYSEYNTGKSSFYSDNTSNGKKGYFITKFGEIQESIKDNQITWEAPALIQFWSAERKYSPEVKQEGLPYSPAKSEIVNELAISEWLPIYHTPAGSYSSRSKFYIDQRSCGQWEVCKRYMLTDSFSISKVEMEIEDIV